MDYHRQSNGLLTFLEHWWFLSVVVFAFLTSQVLSFFTRLSGTPWIWCYVIALAIATVGASLIFYARLPLYRQLQFFTFGSRALPQQRRPFYRWGYRCVAFAVTLLLCLLLSRP
jgi:hypothetical protein